MYTHIPRVKRNVRAGPKRAAQGQPNGNKNSVHFPQGLEVGWCPVNPLGLNFALLHPLNTAVDCRLHRALCSGVLCGLSSCSRCIYGAVFLLLPFFFALSSHPHQKRAGPAVSGADLFSTQTRTQICLLTGDAFTSVVLPVKSQASHQMTQSFPCCPEVILFRPFLSCTC